MAKVGAQRAAVLTGKSKSTIQRAMNSGKLSYELDQNDRRIIDVSELERVFGIVRTAPQPTPSSVAAAAQSSVSSATSGTPAVKVQDIERALEKERLAMQIKMLEQQLSTAHDQIDDLRDQRDKWEKQASQMLITSQYSQRQAEELRSQIKEREERARQRRLQGTKVQSAHSAVTNNSMGKMANNMSSAAPKRPITAPPAQPQPVNSRKDLDAQMQKLKAQNENVTENSASVFRFWKKAKG